MITVSLTRLKVQVLSLAMSTTVKTINTYLIEELPQSIESLDPTITATSSATRKTANQLGELMIILKP